MIGERAKAEKGAGSPFARLTPLGRAKAASLLTALEMWADSCAEARAEGSLEEARAVESRLDEFARRLSDLLGMEGSDPWGWLREEFPENPLNWASEAFAAGQPRHPALWAARSGAAHLDLLLSKGAPARASFAQGRSVIDLAAVAGKARRSGAFLALDRHLGAQGGEERRRQIMAWISGCASSLWAEGIAECEAAFRAAFPDGSPEPYWGDVFASPLEELLWSPEAPRDPERAQEALRALLSLAGEERWPMEADSLEDAEGGEPLDHFESALLAGAWWALRDLACPASPPTMERVALLREKAEALDPDHGEDLAKAFGIARAIAEREALAGAAGREGSGEGKARGL